MITLGLLIWHALNLHLVAVKTGRPIAVTS